MPLQITKRRYILGYFVASRAKGLGLGLGLGLRLGLGLGLRLRLGLEETKIS